MMGNECELSINLTELVGCYCISMEGVGGYNYK